MIYAISETSGKQFLIKPGRWYDIDYISKAKEGDVIYLEKLLLFRHSHQVQVGKPFLWNSQIPARILQTVKGKKLTVLKTKPKKHYTRTRGHRSLYTRIYIE
ncbi:MAG: 50S ribosomal protein L21 [Pedobacter sp.]|nr:MAG: 50S ribosomal protein L21 [Pedobacter sp.]